MKASKRHELKHDIFAETVIRLGAGITKYHKLILLVVIVVAIAVTAIVWTVSVREQAEADARVQLAAARTQVRHALAETGEKQEKAVSEALAMLEAVAADHADTPAAPLALIEAAHLLITQEKPKEAVPYFRKTLAAAGDTPGLATLAHRGLAQALEASGDIEAALEQYQAIRDNAAAAERIQAAWDIGRCHETLKQPAKASAAYQTCKDLGGNTTWGKLADARLQALTAPSPNPKSPTPNP